MLKMLCCIVAVDFFSMKKQMHCIVITHVQAFCLCRDLVVLLTLRHSDQLCHIPHS